MTTPREEKSHQQERQLQQSRRSVAEVLVR